MLNVKDYLAEIKDLEDQQRDTEAKMNTEHLAQVAKFERDIAE